MAGSAVKRLSGEKCDSGRQN